MAIFHCSIKIIGRSKGRSAVAASAYRSGECLIDQETGIKHDYTHKGGVVHSEITLPDHVPDEFYNRSRLWNSVQAIEKNKNARFAREFEVAIPREITSRTDQIVLIREYVRNQLVSRGMIADWSIHDKGDGNPHAHIMVTTRKIDQDGNWDLKEKKVYKLDDDGQKIPIIDPNTGEQKIGARGRKMWQRETVQANDWNDRSNVEQWREAWADACNDRLERLDVDRIDHRSYERQGLDIEPTIHEGYVARKIEAKGGASDRCEINREIVERRTLMIEIKAKITDVIDAIKQTLKDKLEKIGGRLDGVGRVTADGLGPGIEDRRHDKSDRGERENDIASAERASEEERTDTEIKQCRIETASDRAEGLLDLIDAKGDYDPVGRDEIDRGIE